MDTQLGDLGKQGRQHLPGEEAMRTLSKQSSYLETDAPRLSLVTHGHQSVMQKSARTVVAFPFLQPIEATALPRTPDWLHPMSLSLLLIRANGNSLTPTLPQDSPLDADKGWRF